MTALPFLGSERRRAPAAGPPARRPRFRPAAQSRPPTRAEPLEPRLLLATFTVTTTADAGPGSLRQAIVDANTAPGADDIVFAIPQGAAVQTIRPLSALPTVTDVVTIDATTQPGYGGTPLIEIDGSQAGPDVDGLTVAVRPSAIRGFAINRFSRHGVVVSPPTSYPLPRPLPFTTLDANHIGTNAAGDVALGNGGAGVFVGGLGVSVGACRDGRWTGNLISGNRLAGVWVNGPQYPSYSGPAGVTIGANRIGTDVSGTRGLGNGGDGVLIDSPTRVDLRVTGSFSPANLISGNGGAGVRVRGMDRQEFPQGALVQILRNFIGTNAAGTAAIPNGQSPGATARDGVVVTGHANITISGGVISGNAGAGISLAGSATVPLVAEVSNNKIGLDAIGESAIGNGGGGVVASSVRMKLLWNRISGNHGAGVSVSGSAQLSGNDLPPYVVLSRNYIGTNAAGTAAVPNTGNGVELRGATNVRMGGPFPVIIEGWMDVIGPPIPLDRYGNLISGNAGHGVYVAGSGRQGSPSAIEMLSNNIGTDARIESRVPNGGSGVFIAGSAGVTIGASNTIGGNHGDGVTISDLDATPSVANRILNSEIGARSLVSLNPVLSNGGNGITIVNSSNTFVRGTAIARNGGSGVVVREQNGGRAAGNDFTDNLILGNGRLPIDLETSADGPDGRTPNDEGDTDSGPNGLQNFPVIRRMTPVSVIRPNLTADWDAHVELNSEPRQMYRVQLFCTPGLPQQAMTALVIFDMTTDSQGNASRVVTVRGVPLGSVITATATATPTGTSEFSPGVPAWPDQRTVVARDVFYNNSAYDGNDPAPTALDDGAMDATVLPALPGETARGHTHYDKGINGVMIDVAGLAPGEALTASDFEFRVGNTPTPSRWRAAPQPLTIEIRRGAGVLGSDRVTLVWRDGAIRNQWLKVTVKPPAGTPRIGGDEFYFGNLVGDTVPNSVVDEADAERIRRYPGGPEVPTIRYDVNRDRRIDEADIAIVRGNASRRLVVFPAPPADAPPPQRPARRSGFPAGFGANAVVLNESAQDFLGAPEFHRDRLLE